MFSAISTRLARPDFVPGVSLHAWKMSLRRWHDVFCSSSIPLQLFIPRPHQDVMEFAQAVAGKGFAFVQCPAMFEALTRAGSLADWPVFAASWNDLPLDGYMADGGRYRRRRHAVYALSSDAPIERQPRQPHYQSVDYNRLNGGVARWFEPVSADVSKTESLRTILEFCANLFGVLSSTVSAWHIEVHQFRIEARPGESGLPTPEGPHRDGVDHVMVLLVARHNIAQGTTTIHDSSGLQLGSFTLTRPFDAALVDDARVFHGVTPVEPLDDAYSAYRDVLVVTFRKKDLARES